MKTSSMVIPLSTQGGHSAQVNMRLLVNGLSLPVAQLGPDFVLLDETVNHEPATATMVMQIDSSERRWDVRLPNGISADSARVQLAAA